MASMNPLTAGTGSSHEVGETITATQAINSARLSPGEYFSVSLALSLALTLMNSGETGHGRMDCGTGETGEITGENQTRLTL